MRFGFKREGRQQRWWIGVGHDQMQVQVSKAQDEGGEGRARMSWRAERGSEEDEEEEEEEEWGAVLKMRRGRANGRLDDVALRSSVRLVFPALLWSSPAPPSAYRVDRVSMEAYSVACSGAPFIWLTPRSKRAYTEEAATHCITNGISVASRGGDEE